MRFIPAGFILSALSALDLIAASAGIHAWTGGAIGTMTLAVMSRATLGHTGRRLEASAATHLIYASVIVDVLARVCAALEVDHTRRVAGGCRYCLGCGISRICRRLFGGVLVAAPVLTSDKAFI